MRGFASCLFTAVTAILLLTDGATAAAIAADKRDTRPGSYIVRVRF